ncbi:dehydrogenase/reductase SDR family protein 7-like [Oppia nitens]|uniref:dehydrogenase/reductase SDR family protein 7-like n=1 Tax=Oppia nitens TaxID=1686743 RepID=UPI0023DCE869|nr:dehydrogenase/reductase SDR family protein 7-like [Oppia nitens]
MAMNYTHILYDLLSNNKLKTIIAAIVIPYLMIKLYKNRTKKRLMAAKPLKNKVVVITGASSGLGKAMAQEFYVCGAQLVLTSRRVDELNKVKMWLMANDSNSSDEHLEPIVMPLDLSKLHDIELYANDVLSKCGQKVDVIVNNGGISYRGSIVNTSIDVDNKVMLVNYFGQIALIKAFLPSMIEQNNGKIVVISSVQGQLALPYRSAYTASKHALQAFCDSLRAELVDTNISVLVVSPGYIKTNLSLNAVTGSGESYGQMDATTASGAEPQDIAKSIVNSLISDDNQLIMSPIMPKIAIWIRCLFPDIYFKLMSKRAKKERHLFIK